MGGLKIFECLINNNFICRMKGLVMDHENIASGADTKVNGKGT